VHSDPRRFLGRTVIVRTDRPIGSKHESFDIHYPVKYGYIPDTMAPDGEELDAYVLGVLVPIARAGGYVTFGHKDRFLFRKSQRLR
jgi:inorganic pyrophosphatase